MKKYKNQIILIVTATIIILTTIRFTNVFGSYTDWLNQHTVIPDYFRQIFYKTHNLIPNLALNYGAGQNIYNLSYYGFLSPIILPSYILPFISMPVYITIVNIILIYGTIILFYKFLKNHNYDDYISLTTSLLFTLAAPFIFHMHRHMMFVNYMPFLIMGLMGIDKYLKEKKVNLLIISTFLMIMTSYYYSICGLIVLGIYFINELLKNNEKIKAKDFILKTLIFIGILLIPILMSSILLIPTAYTLLQGRGISNNTYTLLNLLKPSLNIKKLFSGTYAIGLSAIGFIALLYLPITKKKNNIVSFILTSIVIFIPLFRYLLNGGLYLREKCLIPFLPLLAYYIAYFLNDLFNNKINYKLFFSFITIISLILHIKYPNLFTEYAIAIIILVLLYKKFNKKFIISIPIIIIAFILCITESYKEDNVSTKLYNNIFSKSSYEEINNIINNDNTFYRTVNTNYATRTVNKIYNWNYYTPTIYSSAYNYDYLEFVRNEMTTNNKDFNYFMYSATVDPLINYFLGVKYVYSEENPGYGYSKISDNIYKLNITSPIIYTTNSIIKKSSYEQTKYPENINILLQNSVIDDDKINSSILENKINNKEINYNVEKIENVEITKDNSEIILNSKNNGHIILNLDEPLVNELLLIEIEGLKENSCSYDDIEMNINGIKNVLTCKTWIYKNRNNTFHFLINEKYINKLDITLTKGIYNIKSIKTYTINIDKLNNLNNSKHEVKNINISNNIIKFNTNEPNDNYLITTIPYDEGFTIYIDGEKANKTKVNTAFLGAKISTGTHDIKITYKSPWLLIGILSSIFGLLLFIALNIYLKYEDKILKIIKNNQEIITYLIFGVLTTIISLLTYYILTFTILNANKPLELQIANILSWIVSVTFAYLTNRKYVFKSNNNNKIKEIIKFYLSRLSTLGVDMLLMFVFVSKLNFNDKIIKIIVQVIVIVLNYILSKIIVFKKEKN